LQQRFVTDRLHRNVMWDLYWDVHCGTESGEPESSRSPATR
jgi:hypothetical protein